MADILPMFPLGIVVFPGEAVNLHIFEPRYKQLIIEAEANDISFGMLPYFEGRDPKYATLVKLLEIVKKYPDGKMDIRIEAYQVVSVLEFFPKIKNKLYPAAEYRPLRKFNFEKDVLTNTKIVELLKEMYASMNVINVPIGSPESFKTTDVVHKVGFNLDQEFEFLLLDSEASRAQFMLNHLNTFVRQVILVEKIRRKAELNGHFQVIMPPNFD